MARARCSPPSRVRSSTPCITSMGPRQMRPHRVFRGVFCVSLQNVTMDTSSRNHPSNLAPPRPVPGYISLSRSLSRRPGPGVFSWHLRTDKEGSLSQWGRAGLLLTTQHHRGVGRAGPTRPLLTAPLPLKGALGTGVGLGPITDLLSLTASRCQSPAKCRRTIAVEKYRAGSACCVGAEDRLSSGQTKRCRGT